MSRPRELLLISDLHLGSHLKPRTRGEYVHLAAEIERNFPRFLAHYRERGAWQLVVNGDFIDFWNVEIAREGRSDEELAVARLHAVLDEHPAVEEALVTFIQAGNGVVFVTGNHDAEFLYPAVRRALAERLERVGTAEQDVSITRTGVNLLRRMEAGRVRFVPWFVREPGGAWIEHGHVFDPACATLSRLSPTRGGTLVQTVAEVATRSFANLMPEMDYHAPDSWTMLDYARWALGRGLRFVVRVVYLYLRMVGRMLGLWAMYGRPDRRGREEHASRLERVAANAGLRMGTLTALARMAPPPAAARIGGVLSVTFMDYVLTCIGAGLLGGALALAPWGTAAIRLPVAVAVGVGLGVLGVRRITRRKRGRDVANDMHDVAGEVAMVTGVPLVLMGHSHHGELSDVGEGIVYGNSGSWLDGFHLVVRRGGDAHLSRVELRRWRNGCVSVEDYRELARGHRGPAAVPEVLQGRPVAAGGAEGAAGSVVASRVG